ncbi:MAG: alpha-1 6-glucosidase, partial [Puniceicoccaceae bacterium 5H]
MDRDLEIPRSVSPTPALLPFNSGAKDPLSLRRQGGRRARPAMKAFLSFLAAVLALLAPLTLPAQSIFTDAISHPDGSKESAWFGTIRDIDFPWTWQQDLGWLYVDPGATDEAGFWCWDTQTAWNYTGRSVYPYLYRDRLASWVYHAIDTGWSFSFGLDTWMNEYGDLPSGYPRPLYLRGSMNAWGAPEADAFIPVGSDAYHLVRELEAGAYTFKLGDPDWATDMNFGAGPATVSLGTASTLAPNGNDMALDIPATGAYHFAVDASNKTAPVLTVSADSKPFGETQLYLRGDMNGWGTDADAALAYIGNGKYATTVTLSAKAYALKVADADWSGATNFGPSSDTALTIGDGLPLVANGGVDNASFTAPMEGHYQFILDASADVAAPKLSVRFRGAIDLGPYGEPLYVSGSIDDESVSRRMLRERDHFRWIGYLAAGTHTFDLQTEEGDLSLGAEDPIALDTPLTLSRDGSTLDLTIDSGAAGLYHFELNAADADAPILTVTPYSGTLVHYSREMGDYAGWGLHLFNVGSDSDALPTDALTIWPAIHPFSYEDDFGVYAAVPIQDRSDTFGLVVHRGGSTQDIEVNIEATNAQVWLVQNIATVFTSEDAAMDAADRVLLSGARWIEQATINWNLDNADGLTFRLYAQPDGQIYVRNGQVETGPNAVSAELPRITDETRLGQLHTDFPWTDGQVLLDAAAVRDPAAIAGGHLVVVALDDSDTVVAETGIQNYGLLDALYAYDGELGVVWQGDTPTLKLWAPTARSVNLRLYDAASDSASAQTLPMTQLTEDGRFTGVWQVSGDRSWQNKFYRYEVSVFAPTQQEVVTNEVTDPYAYSLSTDSRFSQIVDLSAPALTPAGWADLQKPGIAMEDMVIYELHVRDFSINDPSVPSSERGTFKAFTHPDSAGMQHLAALADAGLTHLHLLPMYDFGSVQEGGEHVREFWPQPIGYGPVAPEPQAQITEVADQDGFNWGYDPVHYFTPEGSYATDSNGPQRVYELREAVQALYGQGLRVVQDVVFNHTFQSGLLEKSVFDKIVPGYYYRRDDAGNAFTKVCCPELATENAMVEKLMVDALVHWARAYKIDGFRFDLMGDHTLDNLAAARNALDTLTLEQDGVDGTQVHLYGEGWAFGSLLDFRPGESASQDNLGGSGVGSFNDRIRNGLGHKADHGFIDGNFGQIDRVRNGLAGNLANVSFAGVSPAGTYTEAPRESVNYVTAHDNYTLFDELMLRHGKAESTGDDLAMILRRDRLALAALAVGQGVPFFHAGVDLLRSKSGDRNSYNSGDWFNRIYWDASDNNWAVGLPPESDGDNKANWPHWQAIMPNAALKPSPQQIQTHAAYFRNLPPLARCTPKRVTPSRKGFARCWHLFKVPPLAE